MRTVCIYTSQHSESSSLADRCLQSGMKFGYRVEKYPAVYWKEIDHFLDKLNLKPKYTPILKTAQTTKTTCPATRMANGITHYMLYKECVDSNKPICILEHDAYFVGNLPKPINCGVIQISSHKNGQASKNDWFNCSRARKMKYYASNIKINWSDDKGIVKHPLNGLNGTSGYIIHPVAAQKMINYIERDGIGFADRVRTQWIGEKNLYLQIPQSVICDHKVKSAYIARREK